MNKNKRGKYIFFNLLTNGNKVSFVAQEETMIKEIKTGSFLSIKHKNNKVKKIDLITECKKEYDQNKIINSGKKRDKPWLIFREEKKHDLFNLRTKLVKLFREYFFRNDYVELFSPKLVTAGLKSKSAFKVNFPSKDEVHLTGGSQLYTTIMLASGFEKVFDIGSVFREEREYAKDHVAEFTAINLDFAYVNTLEEVMNRFEEILRYVFISLPQIAGKELERLGAEIEIPDSFPKWNIKKAYKILRERGRGKEKGKGLSSKDEKLLGKVVKKRYDSDFLMIYHYPAEERYFYYMRDQKDTSYTHSFDILYKGTKIAKCAKKEHRRKKILENASKKGISTEKLRPYFSIFNYNLPPHGGGGISLDKLLQQIIGAENIREVIMFPRDDKNLNP